MKHIYLDNHEEKCINEKDSPFPIRLLCDTNPESVILYIYNQYVIITYHRCLFTWWKEHDIKLYFTEEILKQVKIKEAYNVNKSIDLVKDLRNFRIRNKPLKKYIELVNGVYRSTSTTYAITTKHKYLDVITSLDTLKDEYEKTKAYLIENKLDYLVKDLELIDYENTKWIYNEKQINVEIIKNIEELIKKINQIN